MPASVRSQAHVALTAALNAISVATGFNTNVAPSAGGGGAQRILSANQLETLPTVLVFMDDERAIEGDQLFLMRQTDFELVGVVAEDPAVSLADKLDLLLTDIEKVLLIEKAKNPPLSVVGVTDLTIAGVNTEFPGQKHQVAGSVMCTVHFRHTRLDPSVGGV